LKMSGIHIQFTEVEDVAFTGVQDPPKSVILNSCAFHGQQPPHPACLLRCHLLVVSGPGRPDQSIVTVVVAAVMAAHNQHCLLPAGQPDVQRPCMCAAPRSAAVAVAPFSSQILSAVLQRIMSLTPCLVSTPVLSISLIPLERWRCACMQRNPQGLLTGILVCV
jgi:hypothetical protein